MPFNDQSLSTVNSLADFQQKLFGPGSIHHAMEQNRKLMQAFTVPALPDYATGLASVMKTQQVFETSSLVALSRAVAEMHEKFIPFSIKPALEGSLRYQLGLVDNLNQISRVTEGMEGLLSVSRMFSSKMGKSISTAIGTGNWEGWDVLEEQLSKADEITQSIALEGATSSNIKELELLIQRIASAVSNLKISKDKIFTMLLSLMTILSFVKDSHEVYKNDISNKEVVEQINSDIEKAKATIIDTVGALVSKERYCIHECNLRLNPGTNCLVLGKVKENQKVMILGENHKWLCIGYIDDYTGKHHSGWVSKKYFKRA